MNSCQDVVDVIFGKHDLGDLYKVLRLIFLYPEDLGGGKTRNSDVGCQCGQLVLANFVIPAVHLLGSTSIVPENG